jgi:tetratricopeptide (TPR) repeat protein
VLDEVQAPIIAEIARQLDGLPLAIELAAARMSALGERTILERLQSRFQLLAGGARDAAARQRTMHDAIDWSWRLLESWEQAALAQCAVFRGGFTLSAAESVIDLSNFAAAPSTLDVVQALRDKSLLRSDPSPEGERRFLMYESIRAFAEEKLEASGLAPAALRRHARYYVGEADAHAFGVCERDDVDGLHHLAVERENLLAVHRRAVVDMSPGGRRDAFRAMLALDPILRERGPHDVHLALLNETLEGPAPEDPALLGRVALARAARQCLVQGLQAAAHADAQRALQIGRAEGDAWLEAGAQNALAVVEWHWKGGVPDVVARFASARKGYAEAGHAWGEAKTIANMARVAWKAGRPEEAHALCEEALAAFGRIGYVGGFAGTLHQVASMLQEAGRLDEARATFAKMLPLAERMPLRIRGPAFGSVAMLHHECGELDDAKHWYGCALDLLHCIDYHRYEGLFLAALGALLASEDKLIEAQDALDRATSLLGSDGFSGVVHLHSGHLDLARARACAAQGDALAASQHRERAAARLREGGGETTDELRFATRLLQGALEALRPGQPLIVAADGRWFQPQGEEKVDIGRRPQLVRLLRILVRGRIDAPGKPLSVDTLLRAAWPGERFAVPRSGAMRVYVQMSRLRSLGLRDALCSVGDGYILAPAVLVAESDGPGGPGGLTGLTGLDSVARGRRATRNVPVESARKHSDPKK